jgi:hypothetical protein
VRAVWIGCVLCTATIGWSGPEGFEPEVPPPWSPVKWKNGRVEVWGRHYRFDGLPVPASVKATPSPLSEAEPPQAPIELLAGPMELAATVGGQRLAWKSSALKVESKRPSEIVFVSHNEAGGLTLKARTTVEFDGMIRVDLSLGMNKTGLINTPLQRGDSGRAHGTNRFSGFASGEQTVKTVGIRTRSDNTPLKRGVNESEAPDIAKAIKLDKLDLVIPYRQEVAELMSTYRKAHGPGALTQRHLGKVPTEPWKYSVFFTHFIGNNEVGLEWFCDDMRGWRVQKGDEAVEIVRDGDRVNLIFHLVDHPVTLDMPVEITFGLIATPTKPVPMGWEKLRIEQHLGPPPVPGEFITEAGRDATQADTDAWIRRQQFADVRANLIFDPAWSGVPWLHYPLDLSTAHGRRAKREIEIAHAAGQKFCVHGGWYCIATRVPEWPRWGHEMVAQPAGNSGGVVTEPNFNACYNSPFTSFLVANFAANARLVGIDGVRFDTIAPQVDCNSLAHGCGWYDEAGKLRPSNNIFATREFFKRIYRVFHGGVRKDGLVYFPLAGPPINAIDSFVDVHEIGEGSFEHARTLKTGYPQDDVRVRHTGTAYGFITSSNLKGAHLHPNKRIAALFVAGANPRVGGAGMPNYYSVGYEKLYGLNNNVVRIWDAWKWIDVGHTALWKPYWKNKDTIAVTAGNAETYASYYVQPGKRVLLIVANYELDALQDVRVTLDLPKLGFPSNAALFAEDAITQEPVTMTRGALTFDIYGERYRMIKISADRPRFAEDRLGKNVFAEGDFENLPDKDATVKRNGSASLRVPGATPLSFKEVAVEPGAQYVLTGFVKIDTDFPEQNWISVGLTNRDGVTTDPPREFARVSGEFLIGEKTPGWKHFLLPFKTHEQTKQVGVTIKQIGTGTAWVDDVQIRKVME